MIGRESAGIGAERRKPTGSPNGRGTTDEYRRGQAGAATERKGSDLSDARRDPDTRQAGTTIKRVVAEGFHTGRDGDTSSLAWGT